MQVFFLMKNEINVDVAIAAANTVFIAVNTRTKTYVEAKGIPADLKFKYKISFKIII